MGGTGRSTGRRLLCIVWQFSSAAPSISEFLASVLPLLPRSRVHFEHLTTSSVLQMQMQRTQKSTSNKWASQLTDLVLKGAMLCFCTLHSIPPGSESGLEEKRVASIRTQDDNKQRRRNMILLIFAVVLIKPLYIVIFYISCSIAPRATLASLILSPILFSAGSTTTPEKSQTIHKSGGYNGDPNSLVPSARF